MATNGDEYVPMTVPIRSAHAKNLIVEPPKRTSASNIKNDVNELLKDRTIVSVIDSSSLYAGITMLSFINSFE